VLDAALRTEGADAVYVASPVFLHAPQTLAALAARKHVLCEKPMAMNHSEALTMVKAADEASKTLGVAYYRRAYPKLHRALELLRQGAIGRPLLAYITCHNGWPGEEDYAPWRLDPAQSGGGPLLDVGSHRIDVLNFLFGEPQRVSCHRANCVHEGAVEDCATVLIEYRSGARGIVDVRWNSHVNRDEFRIVGSDGEMDLTPLNGPQLSYCGKQESLPPHANLHFPCVQNFVSTVLDGAPLLSSGHTAIWADWVTQLAIDGDAAGRRGANLSVPA